MTPAKPSLFAIRADSAHWIGITHIMRCITLADSLRAMGHEIHFICREHEGNSCELIVNKGYSVHFLPGSNLSDIEDPAKQNLWLGTSPEQDAAETLAVLNQLENTDWLIVDHYSLDAKWEKTVSAAAKQIFVFDDLANRPHYCNLLCDQTPSRSREDYQPLIPASCDTLLGFRYVPIRGQFPRLRNYALQLRLQNKQVNRILITANQFSTLILDALEAIPGDYCVEMVLVPSYQLRDELEKVIDNYHFPIQIRTDTKDMATLMANADIAIGSAGTSAWERCVMGLPSLVIVAAGNETTRGDILESEKAAIVVHVNELDNSEQLASRLSSLLLDRQLRSQFSERSASLIDGYGCSRLFSEIMDLRSHDGHRVGLRPVEMEDAETILKWQSHPVTRKFSRNPAIPTHDEHMAWMKKKLSDPGSVFSIIVEDEKPVGVFRLDKNEPTDSIYEISVLVAPERHRQGIAKHAVLLMNSLLPNTPKAATVLPDNKASHSLFNSAGFNWTGNKYEWWPVTMKDNSIA